MLNILNNMSVYKVFAVSGAKTSAATSTLVTVPAGWCAVIQSVYLKDAGFSGEIKTNATTAFKTAWGNPFILSGSWIHVGATGDDVTITTVDTGGGSCFYVVCGFLAPASDLNRITA